MKFIEILKKYKFTFEIGVLFNILYYDFIEDGIRLIKYRLRQKGLLKNKRYQSMKHLKDTHLGERCFIVATGPSLTFEDLEKIKGEFIFGVNSLVKILDKIDFVPQFLGIQDANVYEKIGSLIENCNVPNIFMTDILYDKNCKTKDSDRYILFPKYNCRHSSHGDRRPLSSDFSADPSIVVFDGYSITYSILQIAVFMGFSEIYLLGCDCSYDVTSGKHHFVESGFYDRTAATVGERMIYAYTVAKKWLDDNKPDVKVYNATRGGMLEVFPRKKLDEIL